MSPSRLTLAAAFVLAAFASPLPAVSDSDESTDQLDDAWADRALANPGRDGGWCITSRNQDRRDGRTAHCEVREFSYPRVKKAIAIDGGMNSGMTVMGGDRDDVRIIYRVLTRARSEERARALAAEIKLELADGWLRPAGPEATVNDWWAVEVKAWVPRATDLELSTHNGPLGVRNVRGRLALDAINGPMSLVDLAGAVKARAVNGPLHVGLAGSHWDGTGLDAEAQNGPLNVELASDYSARLTTGTINGPRSIDYAIEATRGHAWTTTTLGKGGRPVRVVTHNGPFHIGER
jgi:hypothetical protein